MKTIQFDQSILQHNQQTRLALSSHLIERYEKDEIILQQGDTTKYAFLILDGAVVKRHITRDGNLLNGGVYRQSKMVCALTALSRSESHFDIIAIENVELIRVGRDKISEAFIDRKILENFFQDVQQNNEQLMRLRDIEKFGSLSDRVQYFLKEHANEDGIYNGSQSEMAEHIGCSRQALNKVLRELALSGKVSIEYGRLRVLQKKLALQPQP